MNSSFYLCKFTPDEKQQLKRLAHQWQLPMIGVIRRLISEKSAKKTPQEHSF